MDTAIKDYLVNMLRNEYEYTEKSARVTADDLMKIKHPDIVEAINRWVKTRTLTDIKSDEISARHLVEKRNMKYAAALIFIDWYRENPKEAMDALSTMG